MNIKKKKKKKKKKKIYINFLIIIETINKKNYLKL